jgi:TPR repeat protein
MAWNQGFSDQENLQWSMLRAIEWGIWPAFLSQSIAPVLLIFFEWWEVIGAVVILTTLWSFVRYRYVNVAMAKFGVYLVHLKWFTIPAAVIYLFIQQKYLSAVVAMLWIFFTPYLGVFSGKVAFGKIQEMFMEQLGYSEKQPPESDVNDDTRQGVQPMVGEDYSLDCLIQRARAASPTGEVSPATMKRLETLSRELEEVNKKLEEHQEKQAWKEAQRAVYIIKEEVAREERKAGRKRTKAELDTEFDGLVKDIDKLLTGQFNKNNQLESGVNDDTHQGVPQDYKQAAAWYRKAAKQGNALAQTRLRDLHASGLDVPQDYTQAEAWFKEGEELRRQGRAAEAAACFRLAAEQGHAAAQYMLGWRYFHGEGVARDYTQMAFWLRKAAEQGNAQAQYNLGDLYHDGQGVPQDYAQAALWYRKAAEQGNADAQYLLGLLYYHGLGVPQDYTQTAAWYRKAAEQGHAAAQCDLGSFYATGRGVPQDYTQAVFWRRKAAEQGDAIAQSAMGLAYVFGHGVSQDRTQAAFWYRKAAEQGHAKAQFNLGMLYGEGQGVPQDYTQAALWYRKAAEQGDAKAQFNLGMLYGEGQGAPKDYTQAAFWYRKAAEQGLAEAQHNLGVLYRDGQGVPQDYTQAALWYRKAAEQGDALAQYNLGRFYDKGQGVPQDYAESYFWVDLATAGKLDASVMEQAAKFRDGAASHLTPAELSRARERVRKWFEAHQAKPQ